MNRRALFEQLAGQTTGVKILRLLLVLLLLASSLAACGEPATTTTDVHVDCTTTGFWKPLVDCNMTVGSITGLYYRYEVKDEYFRNYTSAADVKMTITVGKGTLLVWMQHPDNEKFSVVVGPGETKELNGLAKIWGASDNLSFQIFFEPQVEGALQTVEDVRIKFTYTIPGVWR